MSRFLLKRILTLENLIPGSESKRIYVYKTVPLHVKQLWLCEECVSKYNLKNFFRVEWSLIASYTHARCEVNGCTGDANIEVVINFDEFDIVWGPYY